MAPPKVAFVTPGSFVIPSPNGSSVERVVEHIVSRLDRGRVAPRIYGRSGRALPRIGQVRGVPCERFPAKDKTAYIREVGRAIRKFGPDVIEVENRPLYALRLKRRFPRRQIWLNLHSSTFIGKPYLSRAALKRCMAAVDRVIVNSHYLRHAVAAAAPEAAPKLRVVHLGADLERFRPPFEPDAQARRERLRRQLGWTDRVIVLYMGRLVPRKGVHHLLAALPKLAKAHPNMMLAVVGSPFYGSRRQTRYSLGLKRMARAAPRRAVFVPYAPYTEVPDWYLAADIAVVPSGPREAFGLVNVEAMASGLPVVATRAGGIVEVVEDGVTGFLVDPNPATIESELAARIGQLLADEELRRRMGAAGRRRVEERFTWERAAEAWTALLDER